LEEIYQACIAAIYELVLPAVAAISAVGIVIALIQSIFQVQDQSLGTSAKIVLCVLGAILFGTSAFSVVLELWELGLRTIAFEI